MNKTQHVDVSTGSTWCNQKFVGSSFYTTTLRKLQKVAEVAHDGALHFPVTLIPEPDNPYSDSGCAISVRWNGKTIGHIPESDAPSYWPEICRIVASGYVPTSNARLWFQGSINDPTTKFHGSVALKDPGKLIPLNDPPLDSYALIPFGGSIQVTKESDHFDVLQDYVPPSGGGPIIVTLHRILVGKNGDLPRVEVRLDGERIGELTKISSEKLLPAVEYFDAMGLSTACNAKISGSSLAAEVVLFAQKATEMADEMMDPEISPLPRFVEFELDPDDYDVPDAWQPSEDDQKSLRRQRRPLVEPQPPQDSKDPFGDALLSEYYQGVVRPSVDSQAAQVHFQQPVPVPHPTDTYPASFNPGWQPAPAPFANLPQTSPLYRTPVKSFSTFAFLTIFGGWIGLHHFYMGSYIKGIVYFMTVGLFLIGWIIDIFTARQQFNLALSANTKRMR